MQTTFCLGALGHSPGRLASRRGRIGFTMCHVGPVTLLRRCRSPPATSHPVLPRRSGLRFPAGERSAWRGLAPRYVHAFAGARLWQFAAAFMPRLASRPNLRTMGRVQVADWLASEALAARPYANCTNRSPVRRLSAGGAAQSRSLQPGAVRLWLCRQPDARRRLWGCGPRPFAGLLRAESRLWCAQRGQSRGRMDRGCPRVVGCIRCVWLCQDKS